MVSKCFQNSPAEPLHAGEASGTTGQHTLRLLAEKRRLWVSLGTSERLAVPGLTSENAVDLDLTNVAHKCLQIQIPRKVARCKLSAVPAPTANPPPVATRRTFSTALALAQLHENQ